MARYPRCTVEELEPCGHDLKRVGADDILGWRFQHGDNPEHSLVVSFRDTLDWDVCAKRHLLKVERWTQAVMERCRATTDGEVSEHG